MRIVAIITAVAALSGCMQDLGSVGDTLARDAAKGVVNNVVQTRLPGVNAAPVTDCIIDNASGAEIVQIAEAALVGANQTTTNLVLEIAARPDTLRCSLNGSGNLGGFTL